MKEIYEHGISFTAALAVIIFITKRSKKKHYDQRDKRYESKLDAIMKAVGAEWNADTSNPTKKSLINVSAIGSMRTWVATFHARIVKRFTNLNMRRKRSMKDYLKKLGKTKFQALLVSLVVNIASAILFMTGTLDVDSTINLWMPIINMTIGTISTWVYIVVEGSIDKAGAAASGTTLPPADDSGTDKFR